MEIDSTVKQKDTKISELLSDLWIDVNIKNNFGRLAFEDAIQGGHGDISEILAPFTDFVSENDICESIEEVDDEELFESLEEEKQGSKIVKSESVVSEECMRQESLGSEEGTLAQRTRIQDLKNPENIEKGK